MKYSKIIVLIVSLVTILLSGCSDEVLNQQPKDSFTEKDVWGDIGLARNYLNEVYTGIGQWGITRNNGPREMPSSATDEAMQRGNHGIWVLNQGNITASDYGAFNVWSPAYLNIRRCNVFLSKIDDVPDADPDEVAQMKAEVRFIRAKNYAKLVDWYSWWEGDNNGVPIITEPFNLDDDFAVKRNSYSEVVDFIVSELDAAEQNLPESWRDDQFGKVTKGACRALKSEILLYAASKRHNPNMDQSKWQKAADAAKSVIDMNMYSLNQVENWQDYANIFLQSSGNPEIILARPYDPQFVDDNWLDKMNSPNGYLGWGGNCPAQTMVNRFQMSDGQDISASGSGYDSQTPYQNREMRFYADVVYNGRMYRGRESEFWTPGGQDSKDGPQGWNTSPTGYTLYKFMDESLDFGSGNSSAPDIIFRYAEILLNYAEAEYHLGDEATARKYLNMIRSRAMLPNITSSGQQLLDDIMHERTIELAFEKDHRWNDVRRWEILPETASQNYIKIDITNDGNGNMTYDTVVALERSFDPKLYSLPIPLEEIQKTDLKQNPGY